MKSRALVATSLAVFVLLAVLLGFFQSGAVVIPGFKSMLVLAVPSKSGVLTLVYDKSGGVLSINGEEPSGFIFISLGGLVKTYSFDELSSKGFLEIDLREGLEQARLQWNIIRGILGNKSKGGVALPTLSIALWLYDSKGNIYAYTDAFSALDYYIATGLHPFKALEKALSNPFEWLDKGISLKMNTSIISRSLVRVNDRVHTKSIQVSSYSGEALAYSPGSPCISTVVYYKALYDSRDNPPAWFFNRFLPEGRDLARDAWYALALRYSQAFILDKSCFPTTSDVLNWLYGSPLYRPGIYNASVFLNLMRQGAGFYWNHSTPPLTFFTIYKPFLLIYNGTEEFPDLQFTITFAYGTAGYRLNGYSYLGYPIILDEMAFLDISGTSTVYDRHRFQMGVRGVGIIIPSVIMYLYDAISLQWHISEYDTNHWIAIPDIAFIPFYKEISDAHSTLWDLIEFDQYGNIISSTLKYAPNANVYALLSEYGKLISSPVEWPIYSEYLSKIPPYWNGVDNSLRKDIVTSVPFPSLTLGLYKKLIISLLGLAFANRESILADGVSSLLAEAVDAFDYIESTFYASGFYIGLNLYKFPNTKYPDTIILEIDKATTPCVNAIAIQNNLIPLYSYYSIKLINTAGGPPPSPPGSPKLLGQNP
ncbi:hypothetical protein ACSU1N_00500 [Thermogladius sp. 4427co]|uniref:hypothetical protein n=1 Tax=Thermogladius sp. 4427co TaxID=3450718 RepID=UPI003F79DC1C